MQISRCFYSKVSSKDAVFGIAKVVHRSIVIWKSFYDTLLRMAEDDEVLMSAEPPFDVVNNLEVF